MKSREHRAKSTARLKGLGLAIALGSALLALSSPASAQSRQARRIDSTFAFGRNAWVDVGITSGTIVISGWTRPEARVIARAEDGIIDADFTNTRIALNARPVRRGNNNRRTEITVEIFIPIGTRVLATSSGGDIRVRGTLAEVQAQSSGGDIEVVDAADRINVQTVGGDLRVEKARGTTTVVTGGGDVEIHDVVGPLSVRSVSSDLVLRSIESSEVRIQTTSGDVTYEGTVDPKGSYEVNAHSGDVHFFIPTGTGASVSLQTYNGDIDSVFPMTLMPGQNLRRQRGQRMEFDIGDGGSRIRIETFSGDITIGRSSPRRQRE
jgi:DUF4097 and DUF4098 domain-containing protein YvlB